MGQHNSRAHLVPHCRSNGTSVQSASLQGPGLITLCLLLQGQDTGSCFAPGAGVPASVHSLDSLPLLLGTCPTRHSPLGTGILHSAPWQVDARASGTTLYSPASTSNPPRLSVFLPVWASALFTARTCLSRSLAHPWSSLEGES